MWKVVVLVPFAFDDVGLANRSAQLDAVVLSPNIQFDFKPVKAGPDLYDSWHDLAMADIAMFEAGCTAQEEGYDALCIDTMSDSGANALRSVLDIPVGIALKESLGKKVGLAAASEGYSRMPEFLTVKGTLGGPKPDIAYAKLVLLAGKAGLGIAGGSAGALGQKASGLIDAITGAGSPASATNSAAPPANALGNALGNLLGGGASRTDTTAKTNAAPIVDLLNLFKKPKK